MIGGPPCQAYSLVGRARNRGISGYKAEDDHRHFLYREYLNVLNMVEPEAFVMENVKGILSSKIQGQHIFPTILEDLADPAKALSKRSGARYRIFSLTEGALNDLFSRSGSDYIIRAEDYGIPQARHRVILLGVREDIDRIPGNLIKRKEFRTAGSVISDLPDLRSGLSRSSDGSSEWLAAVTEAFEKVSKSADSSSLEIDGILDRAAKLQSRGGRFVPRRKKFKADSEAAEWYLDDRLDGFLNHETRGHMTEDLARYLFCAAYAAQNNGRHPTLISLNNSLHFMPTGHQVSSQIDSKCSQGASPLAR